MGITAQYPSIVSLWYLRDLFILCLLSPVFVLIHRQRAGMAFIVAADCAAVDATSLVPRDLQVRTLVRWGATLHCTSHQTAC